MIKYKSLLIKSIFFSLLFFLLINTANAGSLSDALASFLTCVKKNILEETTKQDKLKDAKKMEIIEENGTLYLLIDDEKIELEKYIEEMKTGIEDVKKDLEEVKEKITEAESNLNSSIKTGNEIDLINTLAEVKKLQTEVSEATLSLQLYKKYAEHIENAKISFKTGKQSGVDYFLSEALALGKKLTNVIVAEGQAVTCNDDKTEKTFNEPSRPTTRMESIVIAAKTILGTNLGPSPFSYDERTSTVIGSKYEAIKVLANLLRGQEITVNDFGAAQLLVLRLTIDEALNIINTGTSPAEFDPNNLQSLEFVKIDLETGLKQVVFAQHFKWVKNMAAKGYGINTEKPEGMLDYSEEIFLEAGNDNTELFCTVFGSLEELKQAVTRDIERFK